MSLHIPFISGDDACSLANEVYPDSKIVRVPVDKAERFLSQLNKSFGKWIDPCVDGLDDIESRKSKPGRSNAWFEFMKNISNFEKIGDPSLQAAPAASTVSDFVDNILDLCAEWEPKWITVPQLPVSHKEDRKKINRALAKATGHWRKTSGYSGKLILPLVVTHQSLINTKTARNPRVVTASACYNDAGSDGLWVVDKSLNDETGSPTLRIHRFPGLLALHEELNEKIDPETKIAGPYWGINLALWAKGLVDYPAIGVGTGYQYHLAGGHSRHPNAKIAIPGIRRRTLVAPSLLNWLMNATNLVPPTNPFHNELHQLVQQFAALTQNENARKQVAIYYKDWFDCIAGENDPGLALYTDLSRGFIIGRRLPLLSHDKIPAPTSVAENLRDSCV